MAGWGTLAGKLAEQFQGRVERLKNEDARLEKEKRDILSRPCTELSQARLSVINARRDEIAVILKNKAGDS